MSEFRTRSARARAICEPRWEGYVCGVTKRDPCGGCPLYAPCVKKSPVAGRDRAYRRMARRAVGRAPGVGAVGAVKRPAVVST